MTRSPLFLLLAASSLAIAGSEGIERQLGAHVHGETVVDLVVDGTKMELELTAPAFNIVGFEHAPSDDAQRQAIADALSWLENTRQWIKPNVEAECEPVTRFVHTHGFPDPDASDSEAAEHDHSDHEHAGHKHDQHDKHEHAADSDDGHAHGEHEHGEHGHAEFHGRFSWHCEDPKRLSELRLDLFERFPGTDTVQLNIVRDNNQSQHKLNAKEQTAPLPR